MSFPTRLYLSLGLGGASLFAIAGMSTLLFSGYEVRLSCQRIETQHIDCQKTEIQGGLIRTSEETRSLSRLTGAKVQTKIVQSTNEETNERIEYEVYSTALLVSGEAVPLITGVSTTDRQAIQAEVTRINAFVGDRSQSQFEWQERETSYLFGSIFIGAGILMASLFILIVKFAS